MPRKFKQHTIQNLNPSSFALTCFCLYSIEAACAAHPTADIFINFTSFRRFVLTKLTIVSFVIVLLIGFSLIRSAAASSMAALKQPTIKVVAIIAEGVPESDTKHLIAYARANNKVCVVVSD